MRHGKRRFFFLVSTSLFLVTAACTAILNRDDTQCSTSGDCAKFSATATCVANTCVAADGGALSDAGNDASDASDAGKKNDIPDAHFGIDGCFEGTPTTNDEFLNACTTADCVTFDNCDRLGLCDGGLAGPNPPTTTAPPAAPGADAGTNLCSNAVAATGKQPVYMTGSSNFPPFLVQFAPVLASAGYVAVWQTSNSCGGVDSIYNDVQTQVAPTPAKQQIKDTAGKVTIVFNPDGSQTQCALDNPVQIDIGESDIYAATCTATNKYDATQVPVTTVGEYFGPILPMVFAVPKASGEVSLSAEGGQVIFGRGEVLAAAHPLPYDDHNQLFIRASSTATNQIMSKGIFIDPAKWYGVDKGTAQGMTDQMKVVAPALQQKTIGIISADFVDSNVGDLKALAFQARNQSCGFWTSATPLGVDKRNVRDGHYPLWGPIHFFAKVGAGGTPTTAAATAFVAGFSKPQLDQALLESTVKAHVIPSCAMNVTRDKEMGDIRAYDAPFHCGCFYDKTATTITPADCKECGSSADCQDPARPSCNYGFCEVH